MNPKITSDEEVLLAYVRGERQTAEEIESTIENGEDEDFE